MSSVLKQNRLSHEEYFALEQAEDQRYEYIVGDVFAMAGGSESHALISMNIGAALVNALRGKPCRVYGSDMKLYIRDYDKFCYPDAQVLCERGIRQGTHVENPILVVEVLSESTESYDRGRKFEHYRSIEFLQYYVLVDQTRRYVDFYERESDSRWIFTNPSEKLIFLKLDAVIDVEEIYRELKFAGLDKSHYGCDQSVGPWDKNNSPYGWYVASYLLRLVEIECPHNYDENKRFRTWENTIIVQGNDLDEAYDKTVEFAQCGNEPYKGGSKGIDVQWLFEGVTELLPIYEELEDGSEIMWAEHYQKLKTIRKFIKNKGEFKQ
ncbi:hypothetical protein ANRL3_00328 [Anaerolineae bacterium]|nr:hypothetical protein ANRL3_00328 [Anaerolineae bacterium]